MQIFIKNFNNTHTVFDCQKTIKISKLKKMIQSKIGIPVKLQRLVYSSKTLLDENTLQYYNIYDMSTIHLLGRLT